MAKNKICLFLMFLLLVLVFVNLVYSFSMPPPPPVPGTGSEDNTSDNWGEVNLSDDINNSDIADKLLININSPAYGIYDDYSEQIDELKEELILLRADLDQHAQAIEGLSTDIATINQNIDELSVPSLSAPASPAPASKSIVVFVITGIMLIALVAIVVFFLNKLKGLKEQVLEKETDSMKGPKESVQDEDNSNKDFISGSTIGNILPSNSLNGQRINQIRYYISLNSKRGYSPALIRQGLERQGYSKYEIDVAIRGRSL